MGKVGYIRVVREGSLEEVTFELRSITKVNWGKGTWDRSALFLATAYESPTISKSFLKNKHHGYYYKATVYKPT